MTRSLPLFFLLAATACGQDDPGANAGTNAAVDANASANATAPAAVESGRAMLTGSPVEIHEQREKNFKQIAKANKAIQDELKKPAPDVATIRASAGRLEGLAKQIPSWFPAGSGPQEGVKTEALPAIWEQGPKFSAAAARLAQTTTALNAAAAGGDLAAIRAAAPEVGASCKGCHDSFRKKK
jgi:cytochrome c556